MPERAVLGMARNAHLRIGLCPLVAGSAGAVLGGTFRRTAGGGGQGAPGDTWIQQWGPDSLPTE
eukprot:5009148-Lingulodinium_polyedra.AAC.1